jgi:hypothetical protein
MARNDTRLNTDLFADPAHLRAGADVRANASAGTWHTLASVAVASALLLALFVSVLSLLEAAFPNPQVAQRLLTQDWRESASRAPSNAPTQRGPALLVID